MKRRYDKGEYEDGYLAAIADLSRGFYEGWVDKQHPEVAKKARLILDKVHGKNNPFKKRMELLERMEGLFPKTTSGLEIVREIRKPGKLVESMQ